MPRNSRWLPRQIGSANQRLPCWSELSLLGLALYLGIVASMGLSPTCHTSSAPSLNTSLGRTGRSTTSQAWSELDLPPVSPSLSGLSPLLRLPHRNLLPGFLSFLLQIHYHYPTKNLSHFLRAALFVGLSCSAFLRICVYAEASLYISLVLTTLAKLTIYLNLLF